MHHEPDNTLTTPPADRRLDPSARRVLASLAELIDGRIRDAADAEEWTLDVAARLLGLRTHDLEVAREEIGGISALLAGWHLARRAREAGWPVRGRTREDAPTWQALDLVDGRLPVLRSALVDVPADGERPRFLLGIDFPEWGSPLAEVYLPSGERDLGLVVLREWLTDCRRDNPLRGAVLQLTCPGDALAAEAVELPVASRSSLVLPEGVWSALDVHVHGGLAAAERLEAAGLPSSRGVLIAGPPGVGKTALCRAVVGEVAGRVTVLLVTPSAMYQLGEVYQEAVHLAPTLVVLDDVDLFVGNRKRGGGGSLRALLAAMDGIRPMGRPVLTLATTNEPGTLDAAALRPGRLGVRVNVPVPDRQARTEIIGTVLGRLDEEVDAAALRRLVDCTDGLTGAGITQAIATALPGTDGSLADRVVALVRQVGGDERVGVYL